MKFNAFALTSLTAVGLALAACGGGDRDTTTRAPTRMQRVEVPAAAPAITAEQANSPVFVQPPVDPQVQSASMLRAQVLLDRAGFSPGVIDGRYGENVRQALAAFQKSKDLEDNGVLDQQTWAELNAPAGPAVLASYVITQADVSGPFLQAVPDLLSEQAALDHMGYTSAAELIAERFHMDEDLLRALNPGETFAGAGVQIIVANPARQALAADVARIEVDADEKAVRAYDKAGNLLAFYPATIGSSDFPSPSGSMKVNGVSRNPEYVYDPKKLDYAREEIRRRLTVPAGPNNPVGLVWIDLSKPTYGIHGTPDPDVIGKTQSHGCVRLTNWDVQALAAAVKSGVKVSFV